MSEDLIKKSDAIRVASEECHEFRGIFGRIEERIKELPSEDRQQGEWIYTNDPLRLNDEWACNKCGNISFVKTNFCDRCGARMKGADDDQAHDS